MNKNRWYDKHEGLANHLESLKYMPKRQYNEILKDLIALARLLHPNLFEEHLMEYPLDLKKRRWYDDDPYLWLVINGLRFAEDEVIDKVVAFFDKQVSTNEERKAKRAKERKKRASAAPANAKVALIIPFSPENDVQPKVKRATATMPKKIAAVPSTKKVLKKKGALKKKYTAAAKVKKKIRTKKTSLKTTAKRLKTPKKKIAKK